MKTEPNRNIQRFDSLTSRSLSLQPCRRCRGFLGHSILDFARNEKGRPAHCGELKSLTGGSQDPRPNTGSVRAGQNNTPARRQEPTVAEAIKGGSGFTAADHLICPPVTQAWDKPRNLKLAEPLRPDLNFFRNFDLENPNYKVIANTPSAVCTMRLRIAGRPGHNGAVKYHSPRNI